MTKTDLLIGGSVGVNQLLVAARRQNGAVYQCVNNRVFALNRLKCQILQTWN
jgi:hypothetical protein